jgi:hypothetical protein
MPDHVHAFLAIDDQKISLSERTAEAASPSDGRLEVSNPAPQVVNNP